MADFRYGFCGMNTDKMLTAKELGANYQELNFSSIYYLSDAEFDNLKKFGIENNISYETANCMVPGSIKLTGDCVDYAQVDEFLDKTFKRAFELGIRIVVFGSSTARSYPEGTTYDEAFNQLVVYFKNHVVSRCEKYKIMCVIENLSFGESNILNLIDESYKMIKAVESKWIGILVDFFHFGFNKDSYDSIRKAKDYIKHIHIASVVNDRHFPAPNDGDDYKTMIDLLNEIGYKGRISFEAGEPDNKDFATCAKESLEVFKSL